MYLLDEKLKKNKNRKKSSCFVIFMQSLASVCLASSLMGGKLFRGND